MKTRFAPSPTGDLHIGGARTALFNWLYARHLGGTFVVRIEDTDRERSDDRCVDQILDSLQALGLDYDELVYQSRREDIHRDAVQKLLRSGAAYRSAATWEEVEAWRRSNDNRGYRGEDSGDPGDAVRIRIPEGQTVVKDLVKGDIVFQNKDINDFIIARADGTPVYNLAAAVDDADMGITHVIRGDDHVSNTPKQQIILTALGYEPLSYGHVPLLLNPEGKKYSKRDGAPGVNDFLDQGFLPEALLNYISLLGWGADDEQILSKDDLIKRFDIADVRSSAARVDPKKLRWLNGRWMRSKPIEEYEALVSDYLDIDDDKVKAWAPVVQEKASSLEDVYPLIRFLYEEPIWDTSSKDWSKWMNPEVLQVVRDAIVDSDFSSDSLQAAIDPLKDKFGLSAGKIYQPIRLAISGTTVTPGIFDSLNLLGKKKSLIRIDEAILLCEDQS